MKLLHRCVLLLISVSIVLVVVFSTFLDALVKAHDKLDEARRSASLAYQVNALKIGLDQWMYDYLNGLIFGKDPLGDKFKASLAYITKEFEIISRSVPKESEDYHDIREAKKCFEYLRMRMSELHADAHQWNLDLPSIFGSKLAAGGMRAHLDDTTKYLYRIVKRHSYNAEKLEALDRDCRNKVGLFVIAMISSSMTAVTIVIMGFRQDVARRIEIVYDNFARFRKGEPLNLAPGGSDEIASLDSAFRDLARDLEERTAKDRATFAHMPTGLISCDASGLIESVNPEALRMLGTADTKTVAPSIASILVAKNDDGATSSLPVPEAGSYSLMRVDSSPPLSVEMSISNFSFRGERKFLVALVDTSAKDEIERMKKEFLSMLSHDIQTPLTSIGISLDMIQTSIENGVVATANRHIEIAQTQSNRLIRLTRDLLDLAKADAGRIVLHRQLASSDKIALQSTEAISHLAEHKNISLIRSVVDHQIDCDPDKIAQILVNFLSNSLKYSSKGTTIKIDGTIVGQSYRFAVTDQGRGIPEELMSQVFIRFRQVYDEDSKVGTGLGLSICKMLAEAHGGEVGVLSKVDEGSTFWLEIPINSST